jgi:hypothetical protein
MKKGNAIFTVLFSLLFLSIGYNFLELQKQKIEIEKMENDIAAIKEDVAKINANIQAIEKTFSEIMEMENEIVYRLASEKTGCPVWVLRGIQFAESSYGINCNHPDPLDKGEFGLHEKPSYHAERARKWGEYNAEIKIEAAIIAGYIIMENLSHTHDMDAAISAYRRGLTGTKKNGIDYDYVAKVKQGGKLG